MYKLTRGRYLETNATASHVCVDIFTNAIKNSGHNKPTHYTAIILTMSNYRLNSKSFIDGVIIKCSSQMPGKNVEALVLPVQILTYVY